MSVGFCLTTNFESELQHALLLLSRGNFCAVSSGVLCLVQFGWGSEVDVLFRCLVSGKVVLLRRRIDPQG